MFGRLVQDFYNTKHCVLMKIEDKKIKRVFLFKYVLNVILVQIKFLALLFTLVTQARVLNGIHHHRNDNVGIELCVL